MSLLFNLRARVILFCCLFLVEILVIIFLYHFNRNPFFRMRIMWLLPKNRVEKSDLEIVKRDAENFPSSRNETERNLGGDNEREGEQDSDRFKNQEY